MESSLDSNNNEEKLEIKKQFLTEQIINLGYNTNDFLNFCLNKKENGDDLINWQMDELKQCVKDFQYEIQKQKEKQNETSQKASTSMKNFLFANISQNNNIKNNQNQNFLQSSQINQRINENIQNVNIGSQPDNYNNYSGPKIYKKEIKCKILEKSELNSKKITVKIQNPKQMNTSLLSSSYTAYEVFIKEMNWYVSRRYSDFDWLRNTLKKLFPRHLVPPFLEKKWDQEDLTKILLKKE